MLYFLLAAGLSVVFGLLRFVNFSHGAFYLLGAYASCALVERGVNFWLAMPCAALIVAVIAALTEIVLLRRVYALPHSFHILVTVGLALVIQEVVIIAWGPLGKTVVIPESLQDVIMMGEVVYPRYRLFVIIFTAMLAALLWWVLEGTRVGAVVRAGSESLETMALLGYDTLRINTVVFAFGAGLAGLAGVLAAPIRGVDPFMGVEALAIAFVVVVIGGMGSYTGALYAGLFIGILQSVMSSVWPEGAGLAIYVGMALVVALRPRGLMGRV